MSAETDREDVRLLTVKEYARLVRVHVQTVYSAIRYGRLPYPVARTSTAKKGPIRIVVPRESIILRNSA